MVSDLGDYTILVIYLRELIVESGNLPFYYKNNKSFNWPGLYDSRSDGDGPSIETIYLSVEV